MKRIRTNIFVRFWRWVKRIQGKGGFRWFGRQLRYFLFYTLMFFRKKTVYKKFIVAIDYLLNYCFYPFYITIIKTTNGKNYVESSKWGPEAKWDRTDSGEMSALKLLHENKLKPGPKIMVSDYVLTFKDYNHLINKLKEEFSVEKKIYDEYDHHGLELITWEPNERGEYKITVALSDALKYRFKKKFSVFYNGFIRTKKMELDTNLVFKVLLKLKRDGLLYSYNITKVNQVSDRKEYSKYNLTARGRSFTTDTSGITNLSDEMLKDLLNTVKIVSALK